MTRSYSCYKTDNTFFYFILKNLCGFWGHCLKIAHICMDFKPCFKVYNFVSVYPKSIKLGQMTTLNVIFHVVVSIYRLVKIWNLPQFAAQFWNGQLGVKGKQIRKVLFAIGQGKKTHWARKVYTGKNAAYGFLRVQGTALRFGNKAKRVWITKAFFKKAANTKNMTESFLFVGNM